MTTMNMTANELAHLGVDVCRIKIEGNRIDPVRNVRRLLVQVSTDIVNGVLIEGHRIKEPNVTPHPEERWRPAIAIEPVPTVIEIYADRLRAVLDRVRTPEHLMLREQAQKIADARNKAWREDPQNARVLAAMPPARREQHCHFHGPTGSGPAHWAQELALLGLKGGLPPLMSCEVVHHQTGEKIDARTFLELPLEDQIAWTIDAPPTPGNQSDRAADHMAQVIARAMRINAEETAGGSRRAK